MGRADGLRGHCARHPEVGQDLLPALSRRRHRLAGVGASAGRGRRRRPAGSRRQRQSAARPLLRTGRRCHATARSRWTTIRASESSRIWRRSNNTGRPEMAAQGYDYIIVGAGSAGCVVANRLSADPACRVLLLEAGGSDRNFWLKLPVGYYRTIYNERFSRLFKTEPSEGTGGRSIVWPRGRVLGGSSSINGLIFIRGQHEDFDDWERLGATGWSYRELLPYFRRYERYSRRRKPVSRRPRRIRGVGPAQRQSRLQGVGRRRRRIRPAAQSRFQRRDDVRRRQLPARHRQALAHQFGVGIPAAGRRIVQT